MSVTHHLLLVVGLGLLLACVLDANASSLDYGATGGILTMMGAFTTEHWPEKWGNARCGQPAATEQKDG